MRTSLRIVKVTRRVDRREDLKRRERRWLYRQRIIKRRLENSGMKGGCVKWWCKVAVEEGLVALSRNVKTEVTQISEQREEAKEDATVADLCHLIKAQLKMNTMQTPESERLLLGKADAGLGLKLSTFSQAPRTTQKFNHISPR